jgi:hypothetical protein
LKAELVACEEEKAALDEERATSAKPVKKKRSIFGKLPSDDDDLLGTDGEHPSKPQVIILYLNIHPLCQTDRYPPLQSRKLLRFDDSDMEIDEEPEIKVGFQFLLILTAIQETTVEISREAWYQDAESQVCLSEKGQSSEIFHCFPRV